MDSRATSKPGTRLCRSAVLGALVIVAALASHSLPERAVRASSTPVPFLWLDFTNTASYPGSGTTVTDLSPNGRNGTIRGNGITFNSTTKALQFPGGSNGTAYIELNANMNNFSGGMTIEFEGEFGNTRAIWERIFDFALGLNQVGEVVWVGQFEGTNEIAIEIFKNGSGIGYCYSATNGTALGTPGDRTMNKFVLSIGNDANNLCRIYKNGVELPTRRTNFFSRNISSTGANLNGSAYELPNVTDRLSSFVGRSNFQADNDLEGSIRYLRIYNQALTPSQVAQNATRTVTFNANNGQGAMAPQSASASTSLTTNTFTRAGYTFAGWNTAPGGGGTPYADGASYNFIGDLELHAQWTANPLNVTFDSQGGTNFSAAATTTGGTLAASPGTPSRPGFNFNGWFTAPSGGSQVSFPFAHGQTADFTLFAQWSAVTTTTTATTTTTVAVTTTTTAAAAATTVAPTTTAATTTSTIVTPAESDGLATEAVSAAAEDLPDAGQNSAAMFRWALVLSMLGAGLSLGQSRRRRLSAGAQPISF